MDGFAEGIIVANQAYSFSDGTTLLVYMSSSEEASCELAASYLGASDTSVDPTDLFVSDHCNLLFRFTDPSYDLTEDDPLDVTSISEILVTAECALGDGEFETATIGGQTGYFWLNASDAALAAWYSAVAEDGEITHLESTVDGVELDVNLDSYDGSYPYHDRGDTKARGTGRGTIYATHCAELEETPHF